MRYFPEFAVVAAFYSMARPRFRWVAIESKDYICHEYRYSWRRFVRCIFDPGNRMDSRCGEVRGIPVDPRGCVAHDAVGAENPIRAGQEA
jgi:hypothetical protein